MNYRICRSKEATAQRRRQAEHKAVFSRGELPFGKNVRVEKRPDLILSRKMPVVNRTYTALIYPSVNMYCFLTESLLKYIKDYYIVGIYVKMQICRPLFSLRQISINPIRKLNGGRYKCLYLTIYARDA